MDLRVEEVGEVPLDFVVKPPAHVGEITTWRTTFPGQVFAAVKTEAPCPRDIHSFAGMQFKKDRIELCFSATARDEPVPGFACSPEVDVRVRRSCECPRTRAEIRFLSAPASSRGTRPSGCAAVTERDVNGVVLLAGQHLDRQLVLA